MSKMVRTLSEEAKDIIRNYVEMGREYGSGQDLPSERFKLKGRRFSVYYLVK